MIESLMAMGLFILLFITGFVCLGLFVSAMIWLSIKYLS
jgi:hypothetical protein